MHAHYERRMSPCEAFLTDDLTFFAHMHHQIELLYVQSGCIDMMVENRQTLLRPGDMATVFPHTVHSYQSQPGCKTLLAIFSTDLIADYNPVLSKMAPENPIIPARALHTDIPYMMRTLCAEAASMEKRLLKGYLQALFGRVVGCIPLIKKQGASHAALESRLLDYIADHFKEPLTLENVATGIGVSKYHLSHCFSQKIGCSFNHYINTLRVQYAQQLLLETPLSITEICYEAGFDSISTFYRAFKAGFGETPGNYQRAQLQQNASQPD